MADHGFRRASLCLTLTHVTETDRFSISVAAMLGAEAKAAGKPTPLYLRGPDAKPQTGFAVSRA